MKTRDEAKETTKGGTSYPANDTAKTDPDDVEVKVNMSPGEALEPYIKVSNLSMFQRLRKILRRPRVAYCHFVRSAFTSKPSKTISLRAFGVATQDLENSLDTRKQVLQHDRGRGGCGKA